MTFTSYQLTSVRSLSLSLFLSYLIGEEGYCLTSMQSALAYIESLHTGGAQLPADSLI